MADSTHDPQVNLAELRSRLISGLGMVLVVGGGLLVWTQVLLWVSLYAIRREPFPIVLLSLLIVITALGYQVRKLLQSHPNRARHLVAWGLIAALLIAMAIIPATWVPFLGLVLLFINGLLLSGGTVFTAIAIVGLAMALTYSEIRAYPLFELLIVMALGVVLAQLVVRTLYTTLEWAWTMQQRADHLLALARDRQGELARALKSLESSSALLSRTQSDLKGAQQRAERSRTIKEQFAANISHELRTPLNLILGFSEMIYLSPEIYGEINWPPRLRRAIYQIYRNSRHLLEMIDDILDLSRFEMTGFTLNREPTPVEPLLEEAIEIAQDLFRDSDTRLVVEVASDLPVLEVDRTRIRQVLLNLLSNASRFTEQGMVRVEAKRGEDKVVISVSDTGRGISAEEMPRLFEEFYQRDRSPRRRHGGTGLGLAISKRFVEAHGGYIRVESPSDLHAVDGGGPGSTFTVSLPIPDSYARYAHLELTRALEPSPDKNLTPVLVVDPDSTIVSLVDRHTEPFPAMQIVRGEDLAEAIERYHPRAVVWNVPPWEQIDDAHLPVAPVPIVECSLPSHRWMADALNVRACLTKPVTIQQLQQEVASLGDVQDVLIIDDERGFCQLMEQMLEAISADIEVRRAYDGVEGLAAIRDRPPDLVLLDLKMPRMDGFEVIEWLQQDPDLADVPVVLVTVSSFVEDTLNRKDCRIVIRHLDGLSLDDSLRCLQAVIGILKPRYDHLAPPEAARSSP